MRRDVAFPQRAVAHLRDIALNHVIGAEAVATFQPRDIMVELDYSASMNDDSSLVADITGGVFYNVPPASSIATVQAQLQNVFREIASSRPLKLISGQGQCAGQQHLVAS